MALQDIDIKREEPSHLFIRLSKHFTIIMSQLMEFAHCGILTDVVLASENEQISMHHTILSCFTNSFKPTLKNGNTNYYICTNMDKSILQALADYFYTGKVYISGERVHALKTAGMSLQIEDLNMFNNFPELDDQSQDISYMWPAHEILFLTKIWEMRCNPQECDVVFVIENRCKSYAHACILATCSSFLLSIFTQYCPEKRKPYVFALYDISQMDLDAVLEFCYKGEVDVPTHNAQSVYDAAKLLGVHSLCMQLKMQCSQIVSEEPVKAPPSKINVIRTGATPKGLSDLLQHERLVDVFIFASQKLFKAHSVILSVYSIFFKKLATYLNYSLKDMFVLVKDFANIEAVLDYMYTGEAKFDGSTEEFSDCMSGWLDLTLLPISSSERTALSNSTTNSATSTFQVLSTDASERQNLGNSSPKDGMKEELLGEYGASEVVGASKQVVQDHRHPEETPRKEREPDEQEEGEIQNSEMCADNGKTYGNSEEEDEPEEECQEEERGSGTAEDPTETTGAEEGSGGRREREPKPKPRGRPRGARAGPGPPPCQACGREFATRREAREHAAEHPLPCPVCGRTFPRPALLRLHQRTQHADARPFQCSSCGASFAGRGALNKHALTHAGDGAKVFACDQCPKRFSRKERLDEHARSHTGCKPYACDVCHMRFVGPTGLNHHKATHASADEKKRAVCEICGKSLSRHALWTHMKHHEKQHKCEFCSRAFATAPALRIHVTATHMGDGSHRCESCGKMFTQRGRLLRHEQTHRGDSAERHACPQCPSRFREVAKLRAHQRVKHAAAEGGEGGPGPPPHACSVCGKRFADRSAALYHQRRHFGQHPHLCPTCNKSFSKPYELRDHIRLHHSDDKAFPCPDCERRCATRALLNRHRLTHRRPAAGASPTRRPQPSAFPCASCGKTFPSKLALSNHSRTHNYARPFQCGSCRKAFRYQDSLMKHLQLHRGERAAAPSELPCIYTIQVCRPSFVRLAAAGAAPEPEPEPQSAVPDKPTTEDPGPYLQLSRGPGDAEDYGTLHLHPSLCCGDDVLGQADAELAALAAVPPDLALLQPADPGPCPSLLELQPAAPGLDSLSLPQPPAPVPVDFVSELSGFPM